MPDEMIPIILFITVGITTIGFPIARAFARRIDREGARPRVPSEVTERLERMEQAIDSIAIEIERISEGQRFTTKLLADRTRESLPTSQGAPREPS